MARLVALVGRLGELIQSWRSQDDHILDFFDNSAGIPTSSELTTGDGGAP